MPLFLKKCAVFLFDIASAWTSDQSLLMVEDTRWQADNRGSSSSMEASVSSLTNGTHSSLNTEMEEDELAYSIEHSAQCNTYMHFKGHARGKITHVSGPKYTIKRVISVFTVQNMWTPSLTRVNDPQTLIMRNSVIQWSI